MTETSTGGSRSTRRHIALLGGFRYRGGERLPDHQQIFTAVGGADLDLTTADLPPVFTVTKWSLVGGVRVRVPFDAEVEVESVRLLGGHGAVPPPTRGDRVPPRVRVQSYGVLGGVSVTRG
jgi:hypothetical protein